MKNSKIYCKMKSKRGFLLIENIISIGITLILILLLNTLLLQTISIKTNIEDKVELQQQACEVTEHIENLIGSSKGIIAIKIRKSLIDNNGIFEDVSSIKCKYKDDTTGNKVKDRELSLKTNNKLFINTLNSAGNSEAGGYEIGSYIDNVYISMKENKRAVNIKLKLSKNTQEYETNFMVYIRNFEGDEI